MGGFFCCGPIFPGLAVLFGHLGLSKTNRNPNLYSGRGFAIAGLILGYIGLVFWLIVTIAMHGAMAGMEMAMEQM